MCSGIQNSKENAYTIRGEKQAIQEIRYSMLQGRKDRVVRRTCKRRVDSHINTQPK